MNANDLRIVRISNETLPVKWRQLAITESVAMHVLALYDHPDFKRLKVGERSGLIEAAIQAQLPYLGVISWPLGEEYDDLLFRLGDGPRAYPYAVGVMGELNEHLSGLEGLIALSTLHSDDAGPSLMNTIRFADMRDALIFCNALWHERPPGFRPGVSVMPCQGGADMGLAAECAMLALADLAGLRKLSRHRAKDGKVHVLVPAHDRWDAHKELLERLGGHRYPY